MQGIPSDSDRQKDPLECGILIRKRAYLGRRSIEELRKGLWCDVSQSHVRKPWSEGELGVVCTSSVLYSYELDSIISGSAHMMLMGHQRFSGQFLESQSRDLAGEAYSAPWATAAAFALLANPHASWWVHS